MRCPDEGWQEREENADAVAEYDMEERVYEQHEGEEENGRSQRDYRQERRGTSYADGAFAVGTIQRGEH